MRPLGPNLWFHFDLLGLLCRKGVSRHCGQFSDLGKLLSTKMFCFLSFWMFGTIRSNLQMLVTFVSPHAHKCWPHIARHNATNWVDFALTFRLQWGLGPHPHRTRACKFECKPFDVACMQYEHCHSHTQVPFVLRRVAHPVWMRPYTFVVFSVRPFPFFSKKMQQCCVTSDFELC